MYKFFILFIFACAHVHINAAEEGLKVQKEISALLEKWSLDFNAKNIEAVCGLFATDVVATYPGTKDKNFAEMCLHLTQVMKNPDITYKYAAPKVEQVIVEGDLAIVRLIWTLNTTNKNNPKNEIVHEKGLDVFRRQSNGSWKIVISYAFPMTLRN